MTGRLDPASIHASVYLPVFMPILLPILVLFLPVLDMCLAIVRRLSHGQSPMHPDRMHLHHRMLRIGHTVQGSGADSVGVGGSDRGRLDHDVVLQGPLCAHRLRHRRGVADGGDVYPYLKRRPARRSPRRTSRMHPRGAGTSFV